MEGRCVQGLDGGRGAEVEVKGEKILWGIVGSRVRRNGK